MAVYRTGSRSNLKKTIINEADKLATEEKTDISHQNDTIKRIPILNSAATDSEQTDLSERDVKSTSIINKLYGILKLCVEAVVSVFSYVFNKIGSFFTYIFSKFLKQTKPEQATPVIPTNDNNSMPRADNEPFEDNIDAGVTTSIETITTVEDEYQGENPVIESKTSASNSNSIVVEIHHEDNEPFEDNIDSEVTTGIETITTAEDEYQGENLVIESKTSASDSNSIVNIDAEVTTGIETITTAEDKYQDENPVIESQTSANDKDSLLAEIHLEDSELTEDNIDPRIITDTEIQNPLTKKDEYQDDNSIIENYPVANKEFFTNEESILNIEAFQDSLPSQESKADETITEDKLPSGTAYTPIQSDLAVTNKNNNKKAQSKRAFGKLKSRTQRTLKAQQKLLDKSFNDFFKKYSKSACDISTLIKISSCSQEDFNKMFIDKSIHYLKKKSKKKITPSDILTFINNTIIFVNMVKNGAVGTDKIQAQKCKNMMEKTLENYIELQVNTSGNDTRSFTADDSLSYMRDFINANLYKDVCSKETADSEFLVDIIRYDPDIEFFENNNLVWSSTDMEAVEVTKKLKTCDSELKNIDQSTKEYADKSSELKEIENEVIQYRRSQIQKFLTKDNSEITSFLLREQSQAGAAAPATLAMSYINEKLHDAFINNAPNIAIPSADRKFNIAFYKIKDDKVIIKATLSGKLTFITDDMSFENVCPFEAITEIEYDFKNPDNNHIIKGQLKLSPTV
jgi:hypothetical protein